jgi:hypothetical protein
MMRSSLLLGLVVVAATACTSTTYTARSSVNPVLLGPVHRIGGAAGEPGAQAVASFSSGTSTFASYSSSSETETTGHHGHHGHSGHAAHHDTHTTTTTETDTYVEQSGEAKVDWDVVLVTGGNLGRQVILTSLGCGGWDFSTWAWYMTSASCDGAGHVIEGSGQAAPAAAPPAPNP